MKTLEDFKQEVLQERYPNCNIDESFLTLKLIDEAAELYAAYKAKEAWNEAMHWACANVDLNEVKAEHKWWIKNSILNGLKQ